MEHFDSIRAFVEQLEDDSKAIEKAKKLFKDNLMVRDLAVIKGNFTGLVAAITALEGRLPLKQSIAVIEKVEAELTLEPFASKLKSVLDKNPDFKKLRNLAHVLNGTADLGGAGPNDPFVFSQAPITSVDCERTFSKLKAVLTDYRTRLTEKHVRDMLLVQWNAPLMG